MSTDIRLIKGQLSKIIQLGRFFGLLLVNLGRKALTGLASFQREIIFLDQSVILASNEINKFERKINRKGAVGVEKGFALFISNKDVNDIIKIKKSLGDLCVLLDGVTTEPAGADQSIFIFNNIRKKKSTKRY